MYKILGKIVQHALVVSALVLGFVAVSAPAAYALDPKAKVKEGITAAGGAGQTADLPTLIQNVINVILFIAGATAVIMIILGAIRYITSNGDQAHVKAGKDTVLYAVIGLIVAIMAYAIVNFVVSKL